MNAKAQWSIVTGVVAATVVAVVIGASSMSSSLQPIQAGSQAPEFRAVQVAADGTMPARTLADYKGQVVLLNIWATWCDPCREEMPSIERLYKDLGPQGLKVIAVSIDNPGMEAPIRDFVKSFKLSFDVLYDQSGKIRDDYQTAGVPETFIIGRDGTVRKRVFAATDWNAESQKVLLRQLLAEKGS
jgi:cytochrome c biogenesis protein CcmG/thiol:disulfide interchange protein DsbE